MDTKKITQYFVMFAIIIILGWDGYRMMGVGYEGTISYFFIEGGRKYPMIPFLFGVVIGHIFWTDSQYTNQDKIQQPDWKKD